MRAPNRDSLWYNRKMNDAPKSALDLVLERLRQKDAEAGVTETPLTDQQREAIAEARRIYDARVAERKIMHQSSLRKTLDPAACQALEEDLRRDLDRFASECDAKVRRIREGI
jgi:hypothetical protein